MAELKKPMFGNIKGTFGKAVFRQRYGSNYIVQKPSSYTPPNTEDFFTRTNKFKIASMIAKTIISIPNLKEIWKNITPKNQNPYNLLISKNYFANDGNTTSNSIMIVPKSKVGVQLDTINLTADNLNIKLLPLTEASLINPLVEKKIQLISLIFLSNPINTDAPKFDLILLRSATSIFDLITPIVVDMMISTSDKDKIAKYQTKIVHSTLITYDENDNVVNYSNTFSSAVI